MRAYEILNEVNMSPSALKSFMNSPIVQHMKIGFEAEMLVPGLIDYITPGNRLDWRYNIPIPTGLDYLEKIKLWLESGNEVESPRFIQNYINKIKNDITNYHNEKFLNFLHSSKGSEELSIKLGEYLNTNDKEKILKAIKDKDESYRLIIKKMSDKHFNSEPTVSNFFKYHNIIDMESLVDRYYTEWPYRIKYKGTLSLEELRDNFENFTGFDTESSVDSHSIIRKPNLWIFETDGSLLDKNGEASGIELVSPPMSVETALESLNIFWDWTKILNIKTNETCGFHIGVSIKDQSINNIDIVKLALFLGDNYVLKLFNRLNNKYTKSALNAIIKNIDRYPVNKYIKTFKSGLSDNAVKSIIKRMSLPVNEKYMTIHLHSKYIEFRSAGGNYLENKTNIENTLIRYIKAMAIAADPNAERDEYIKKLYKMLDSLKTLQNRDTVHLFAEYTAGKISLQELKSKLIDIHHDRTGPNRLKSIKDQEAEYLRQEKEWEDKFGIK